MEIFYQVVCIFFFVYYQVIICCITPAEIGGESPIVFNRDLLEYQDKKIMDKIKKKGVRYIRNMKDEKNSSYLTWQSTFETKSKEVGFFFIIIYQSILGFTNVDFFISKCSFASM